MFLMVPLLFVVGCAGRQVEERQVEVEVRVALCQIASAGSLEGSLARVDRALADAAQQGAVLAVFPEACLFGWLNPEAHEGAHPIPGPTVDRLGELAREHGLMLAIGLAERGEAGLHNTVVLIDSDGTLLAKHRKNNVLDGLMEPPYTAGVGVEGSVVETRFGRIGLLICADTFQDETVAALAEQAPDLVLVPYGWAASADAWPEHGQSLHGWVSHTARRTRAHVIGVDAVGGIEHGPWKGMIFGGQSIVCSPDGRTCLELGDRIDQVVALTLSLPVE